MHKIIGNYLNRQNEIFKFLFSTHKIKEIKNNSILVVKDQNHLLPYMAQIQTDQGRNGIVLKIDQNGDAYIGMYEPFENCNSLQIKQINKNWKKSFNKITQSIINHQNNSIFDVNSNKILQAINDSHKDQKNAQIAKSTVYNGSKRRVKTSSPILNICNDIYYGDMISFLGCRGSKKTSNAVKIISDFNNDASGNSVSIYINPQFRESKQVINKKVNNVYAFSVAVAEKINPTDIGVYMLTLKTIGLCNKLKEQGLDVLLVVDNFKQILTRQWNFMQTIKFDSKKTSDSSASFQYNNIKIAPISILNEIFSSCNDQNSSKSIKKTNRKGSLTALVLSQKQQKEQLIQSITSYSNNIKHMITLSNTIDFPIDIKTNKNSYVQKDKFNKINNQQQEHNSIVSKPQSPDQIYNYLRRVINDYLVQKKQSELKRNLYKNDIRDSPWDYYNLLDAQWWIKGLKQIQISSYHECKNVSFWLKFNIQKQIISQWTISAKLSYTKFIQFLIKIRGDLQKNDSKTIQFTREDMQQFLEQAKIEGLLNPFKKDYLL